MLSVVPTFHFLTSLAKPLFSQNCSLFTAQKVVPTFLKLDFFWTILHRIDLVGHVLGDDIVTSCHLQNVVVLFFSKVLFLYWRFGLWSRAQRSWSEWSWRYGIRELLFVFCLDRLVFVFNLVFDLLTR